MLYEFEGCPFCRKVGIRPLALVARLCGLLIGAARIHMPVDDVWAGHRDGPIVQGAIEWEVEDEGLKGDFLVIC